MAPIEIDPAVPPPLTASAFRRRQRAKNIALFLVLLGLVALFYAITIAKISGAAHS